jgi:sirohydrochlorin cobaltochelatase
MVRSTSVPSDHAIILFAHGARDPRWAEPFTRVAERVRGGAPDRRIELAYLEFLAPDLREATRRLVADGVTAIRVVPLFFGRGGHLRTAVPRLIAETAKEMPGVAFELADAAGEDAAVIEAIAAFCLRAATEPHRGANR